MKKVIFTLLALASAHTIFAQTTYYWVGGTGIISFTANNNWNTQLDGSGTQRGSSPASTGNTDILIIDGNNVGGTNNTPASAITVNLSNTSTGQLKLRNNITVNFVRPVGGGGAATLNITGNSASGDDFEIPSGCSIIMNNPTADGNTYISLNAGATGLVGGTVTLSNTGAHRITSLTVGGLVFANGSVVNLNTTPTATGYPFGNNSQVVPLGIVFESGASLYNSGTWSPMGQNSSSLNIDFKPGSNLYIRSSNAPSTGNWTNGKPFANLYIQNGATFTADGSIPNIENLTIDAGCTFITHTSGTTPVKGNLINNGILKVPDANPDRNNRIMLTGTSSQNISGTGTYNLADFVVSNQSQGVLQTNIIADTSTKLYGTLDHNGFNINGPTATFPPTASIATSGNTTSNSYVVLGVTDLTGVEPGMNISGTNIPSNTVVVTTFSNGSIVLSNPATGTGTGLSFTVFNNQTVMPVTFKNITATAKDEKVNINWTVGNEYNVAEYVVERSVNAREFAAIGSVKATGAAAYNFTDANPLQNANYYRIKSVDKDGTSKYSTIVRVNMNGKGGFAIMENPVKGNTVKVNIANVEAGKYSLSIINSLGQTILSEQFNYTSGSLTKNINIPNVNKGIYNVVLRSANTVVTERIVVE